jgi:hypothetical protein
MSQRVSGNGYLPATLCAATPQSSVRLVKGRKYKV